MVRSENARVSFLDANGQTLKLVNLYGSSEDTKPTEGLASGSTFVEVDTGKLFLFNEAASTWLEIGSGSGDNPNSVQVITGTALNPFGDMSAADVSYLQLCVTEGNATAFLDIDASLIQEDAHIQGYLYATGAGEQLIFSVVDESADHIHSFGLDWIIYYEASAATSYELYESSYLIYDKDEGVATLQDVSAYLSLLPTTLTIYWHPMPEGE